MDFLFERPTGVAVSLDIYESTDDNGVFLSQTVWNNLQVPKSAVDRVTISISRSLPYSSSSSSSLNSITCWGILDPNATGLSVPRRWAEEYPNVLLPSDLGHPSAEHTHSITLVQPVALSEVILSALSQEAYAAATSHKSALEDWFLDRQVIFRQGTVYTLPADALDIPGLASSCLRYQLVMAAPVQQGCIQKGFTKVYVSASAQDDAASDSHDSVSSNEASEATESEKGDIEIGEDFLAGSVLRSLGMHGQPPASPNGSVESGGSVPEEQLSENLQISLLEWSCKAHPLSHPVSLHQDDCSVYVHTSDLSRIGVLNGDWLGPVMGQVIDSRVSAPKMIFCTISVFLRALQDYFKGTTRLVKQGDIITVKINTDELQHLSNNDSSRDDSVDEEEMDRMDSEVASLDNANEPVFFIVTNIEHNVLASRGDGSSPDMYVGATVGELGCWVDSSITRMIQTGIEHSRVPDVGQYLGIALNRRAVDYHLQLSILLQGPRGIGKMTVATWVVHRLGIHIFEVDAYDIIGENDVKTEGTLRARFDRAASCTPCVLVLRHIDAFAQTTQGLEPGKEPAIAEVLRDCIADLQQSWSLTGFPLLVFGTTDSHERVPPKILSCFKHEIVFEAPGEVERYEILTSALSDCAVAPDVSIQDLAVQTAALVAVDLIDLVSRAKTASIRRSLHNSESREFDIFSAGVPLTAADFDVALSKSRASYSESIGAPKIPSVSWDDVGGLAHVKADILDTIQLPLQHPELFAEGLKQRSGMLLYGPPGTGKTLLAKAVATSCALNFFSVKGPELLNMYIGESEANVRRVFQRARDARPCVIFFDELDSVAPKRGAHGDSGGVMDRIVSQILAELDGLSSGKSGSDVFVIGATNRPDLLDPALLRPGRFDRMLYLGVSNTHAAQLNILQALTRKFRLHPDLRLEAIAERCPFHYTGADFYALCADALLKAMSRKSEELEATLAKMNSLPPPHSPHPYPLTPQYYLSELATPAEIEVLVSEEDFNLALKELVPSVSQAEMEHYARIQQRFSKETINRS
ncbi:Peroxisomal biogenesis factor 6 [Grifola frondosa]|uniref:Peroxisomal ATPase PEX6 n=1 Tax=Grifola frondosa TaxID=5627 RepID=A0A1C7MFS6_GRIFR|nr:Peroxisomal biogenesis factor 6 [Grifola frondosa]